MTIHALKIAPHFYEAVADGSKNFEVRRDDREPGYNVGDVLVLCCYDPDASETGVEPSKTVMRLVTYVLRGGQFDIGPESVVLGMRPL